MLRHTSKLMLALFLVLGTSAGAQTPTPAPQIAPTAPAPEAPSQFKQEELDQMLAPIALYPDSLLSQVLMASTYPLEIVEADRWVRANKSLQGDALAQALEAKDWDASVKSLVNFPDVLSMLSERLEWTRNLGDAFIGQQQQVLDTVQKLRAKARQTGNLQTNFDQVVKVEQAGPAQTIIIEQPNPDVIYVPVYDPGVVYGPWWYPAYPPYRYYPYGYYPGAFISFGLGVAWGYAWGYCDWHHHDVYVDYHRNWDRNHFIDHRRYERPDYHGGGGQWEHNAVHRRGVGYRDNATAQRFGGRSALEAQRARNSYRGHAEVGRQDIQRRGPQGVRPSTPSPGLPAARPSAGRPTPTPSPGPSTGRSTPPTSRPTMRPAAPRPSTGAPTPRPTTPGFKRTAPTPRPSGGALNGVNRGGAPARAGFNRGNESRSSSPRPSGGAPRSGGGRGGRGG